MFAFKIFIFISFLALVLAKVQLFNDQKVVMKHKDSFNSLIGHPESDLNEIFKLVATVSSPSILQKNAAVIKMTLMFFMWYAFNAGYNGKIVSY